LLIDLSYNSSRLEGNTYSLLDTERLIFEGVSVAGKLDEEKIMILNHKEAIRHLVDQASMIQIDENEIFTLHYLLADGLILAKYAGKVRDHSVRIGQSTYFPYAHSAKLISQLKLITDKANNIVDPFEQSVFLLVHIAYLQAFADVNKRTARLSANIPLIKHNYVPLSFNAVEKDDYTKAMIAIYELNEVRPLVELYIASYLRTCMQYTATMESFGFDEVRVHYRNLRRELLHDIIAKQLTSKDLQTFIELQAKNKIKTADRKKFIKTIEEDLHEISPTRIVGIGISMSQLNSWLKKREND